MRHRMGTVRLGGWVTAAPLAAMAFAAVLAAPGGATGTPESDATAASTTVGGAILIPGDPAAGPPATVHVRIEHVSRAAAPATVISGVTQEEVVVRLHPDLTGGLWKWQRNVAADGTPTLTPDRPEHYTVTFLPEGRLAIQADCNRAMGAWTVAGAGIDLTIGGVTRRGCPPGSLMHPFLDALDGVVSYGVHDGTLALAPPEGEGVMVFAPVVVEPEGVTAAAG